MNAKQFTTDYKRDKHSQDDQIFTKRIPNEAIEKNVDSVANSIAKLARIKYREIKEQEESQTLMGFAKGVANKMLSKLSEKLDDF